MFGDETATQLRQFQARNGLQEGDVVDHDTAVALETAHSPAEPEPPSLSQLEGLTLDDGITFGTFGRRPRVRALQGRLTDLGFPRGIDGMFGPETAGALQSFQGSRNLPQSTTVDRVTADALEGREPPITGEGAQPDDAGGACPPGFVPVATET